MVDLRSVPGSRGAYNTLIHFEGVLRPIAAENANKEIEQSSIAQDTVKWRVKNILSKLGAGDRTQAAMIGVKRGIIEM
jgi:DNA-binding NarL/FixJ family response regulator